MFLEIYSVIFPGLIVGALIRYTGSTSSSSHVTVVPEQNKYSNISKPPDSLWLKLISVGSSSNKTYSYTFRGPADNNEMDLKVCISLQILLF